MRSFLTMLGIIIGVASVIILVSLVNAYMSYMVEKLCKPRNKPDQRKYGQSSVQSVAVDEMYAFYEENTESFDHMTPMVSISATVKTARTL